MFRFRPFFFCKNPVAQDTASRILCKSADALPRSEQSCVWSWLSRQCDGDLGGAKNLNLFGCGDHGNFTQTSIPQEETAREYWNFWDIFLWLRKTLGWVFEGLSLWSPWCVDMVRHSWGIYYLSRSLWTIRQFRLVRGLRHMGIRAPIFQWRKAFKISTCQATGCYILAVGDNQNLSLFWLIRKTANIATLPKSGVRNPAGSDKIPDPNRMVLGEGLRPKRGISVIFFGVSREIGDITPPAYFDSDLVWIAVNIMKTTPETMASGEDIESFLTTDVKNGYSLGKFLFSGFSVLRSLTPRTRITTVDLALFVAWSKKWVTWGSKILGGRSW